MKKILIVLISALLVLSVGMVASADTNTKIYLDVVPSGTLVIASDSMSLTGVSVGGDVLFDKIKAGLEYTSMTLEDSTNATILSLKGGYQVIANDQFNVDVTGTYYSNTTGEGAFELTCSGLLIGGDAAFIVTPQIVVSGTLGLSLSASSTVAGVKYPGTTSIMLYGLKGTYLISEQLGITAGYRSYANTMSSGGVSNTLSYNCMSLGVVYKP